MIRRLLISGVGTLWAAVPAAAVDDMSGAGAEMSKVATGVSSSVLSAIIITIACALLVALLLRGRAAKVTHFIREKTGKRRIRKVLRKRSPDILEDLIIAGAYGGLTRINYAVLTSGGILCIQTNYYNGIVFGSDDEPQWKNVDGIHQRKFLNPMIQNAGRTKALQKVVPTIPVANLVVFTGSVQLTAPKVKNVIHVRDLDSYIAKFVFGPCRIKDWDAVLLTVKSAALTDEDSRKDFRAQLSFS